MSQSNGERLDSWKEIAVYLGRDLRTVRRWEKKKGLPVRRVPGGERRAVFAYRADIDSWLKGQENGEAKPAASPTIAAVEVSRVPHNAPRPGSTSATIHTAGQGPLKVLLATLFGLMTVAAYVGLVSFRTGPIAQAIFNGNSIVARDGRGTILWSYDFDWPLAKDTDDPARRITIADLGPDRQRDLLVVAPFSGADLGSSANDTLFCFSARGKMRWRRAFDQTFRFGQNDYRPPWEATPMMVTADGTGPSIWIAARQRLWSTSTLTEFDREGNQKAQFVNWGHIGVIGHVHNANGSFILAGGISNQCNCAMLAVLREDSPSGSSPSLAPDFTCRNCPEGKPYRYILFPQSELTELSGTAYNNVKLIRVDGDRVWAGVGETKNPGSTVGADWIKYDFSADFAPLSFTISDHFWTFHRQMEAEGKIHHTVERCPELGPRRVQMWSAERGWEWKDVVRSTER
jgi:hypothetical protein